MKPAEVKAQTLLDQHSFIHSHKHKFNASSSPQMLSARIGASYQSTDYAFFDREGVKWYRGGGGWSLNGDVIFEIAFRDGTITPSCCSAGADIVAHRHLED